MHIDTHRHMGGCISPEWVWKTICERNWSHIAGSFVDVESAMTFATNESWDFHRFLGKFTILDRIQWDEQLIDSSIAAICAELEKEELDFCWMDFSINKYMNCMNWHKKDAIQFIHKSFETHFPNRVGLILSLKYESMRAGQRQYAKLIDDPEIADLLFGIDLVGDEAYFDTAFYEPIFKCWNKAGKMTRAHVAESQSSQNGYSAAFRLKVTNIAHGLKMISHQFMVDYALDNGITFDLGISSNYLTGVWTDRFEHPVAQMLDKGLRVTLGTDDPVQCKTTLKGEFLSASKLGVTDEQQRQIKQTAEQNTNKYK